MTYNWEKIFKSKSDKELFQIYLGKTHLDTEAKSFAEAELKIRNFDFNNLERHRKKWELEELVEEEKENKRFLGVRTARSNDFLTMGIFALVLMIAGVLNMFFNFLDTPDRVLTPTEKTFIIIGGLGFSIFGFIMYNRRIRKEKKKEKRVKELIAQL